MADMKKVVDQLCEARAKAWEEMAEKLPNNHILAVELFRTERNETLAVFTVVRDGRPVQQILRADERGGNVKAVIPRDRDCKPVKVWPYRMAEGLIEAVKMELFTAAAPSTEGVTASGIALGEPPPKREPEPGIVSLANAILPTAFDVGERLASEGQKES
jgi:hypothetical protein